MNYEDHVRKQYTGEICVINENVLISKRFSQFSSILFAGVTETTNPFLVALSLVSLSFVFNNSRNLPQFRCLAHQGHQQKRISSKYLCFLCESGHSYVSSITWKKIDCQPVERCILCDVYTKTFFVT